MEKKIPKVLVVSINAWIDNTGINTLINFFKEWDADQMAQIYTRSVMPNTKICNEFFQISENAVVKSVLKRNYKTGKQVYNTEENKGIDVTSEQNKYNFARKHRSELLGLGREIAWKMGKWKTKELDEFLENCNPDILFIPLYAYPYMSRLQNYIIKKINKPVITYVADDVYFYKAKKGNMLFYIKRFFQRRQIRKIMKHNDKLFVIAPKLKEVFDKEFNTDSKILTKGIDFKNRAFEPHKQNELIRLVYTGKTNIGRWKSLAMLGQTISELNRDERKFELHIYTTEELTDKVSSALNIEGASKVMGGISLDEVMRVQKEADIVVFAESLDKKYKDVAWLSFSTKLTDYMANGKCIFAIGDKDIAPIEYLRDERCALIASTKEEITKGLKAILEKPSLIDEYAKRAYACGETNHNDKELKKMLKDEIIRCYNERNRKS